MSDPRLIEAPEGWAWLKSAQPTVSKTGSDVVLSFASGTDAAQALGIICEAIASPSARDVVPTTPFIDGYFAQRIRNGETPPGCPAPDAAPTQSTLANLRKQIARTISDLGFWEQRIESALPSAPTPGMGDDEAFKRGVERGMIYAAGLVAKWSTLGLKTIEDGIRSRATSVAERLASDGALSC